MNTSFNKPIVLVLGSSGQIGKLVVQELEQSPDVRVRLSSRRPEEVERLRGEGKDAVQLDLDDPSTFALALAGVDVNILSTAGASIERGKAAETGLGSGKWTYTATSAVAPGTELLIEMVGVDYAGNEVKITETRLVGGA